MREPSVRIWKPRTRKGPLPGEPEIKESWTWFWALVSVGILAPPLVAFCVTAAVSAGSPPVPAPVVEVVMEAPPEDEPETPQPAPEAPEAPGQCERVPGDALSDLETAFVEGTGSALVRLSTSDEEELFNRVRGEGKPPWLEGCTIVRLGAQREFEQTLQLTGRGPRVVIRMERINGLWRVIWIRPAASDPTAKTAGRGGVR